jgi:hypothetical protein
MSVFLTAGRGSVEPKFDFVGKSHRPMNSWAAQQCRPVEGVNIFVLHPLDVMLRWELEWELEWLRENGNGMED